MAVFNAQKITTGKKTVVTFAYNNYRSMIFTNTHATDAVTIDLWVTSQTGGDITPTLVYAAEAEAVSTSSVALTIDNGSGSASAADEDTFLKERVYKSDGLLFGTGAIVTTTLLTFSGGLTKAIADNDILYTGTRYLFLNNVKIPNGASLKLTADEFNFDSNNYNMYVDTDSSTGGINIITRY